MAAGLSSPVSEGDLSWEERAEGVPVTPNEIVFNLTASSSTVFFLTNRRFSVTILEDGLCPVSDP